MTILQVRLIFNAFHRLAVFLMFLFLPEMLTFLREMGRVGVTNLTSVLDS